MMPSRADILFQAGSLRGVPTLPGEPDAAAVASLATIVTVLTFLSSFVSVRLHSAYREALERQRQLDFRLTSGSDAFPVNEMEDAYESVRQALPGTLATPVLGVLMVFTALGVWLTVLTAKAAHMRWFDNRVPERFYALALLALALAAVTALVGADYVRLRRRLQSAIAGSPVHQILHAETLIGTAWADKQRWSNANQVVGWPAFARGMLTPERHKWETKLGRLNEVPVQQRDAAWERASHAVKEMLALRDKQIALWDTKAENAKREQEKLGPGFGSSIGEATRELLDPAQEMLTRVATRRGTEN